MTTIVRIRDGQPLPEGTRLGPNRILAIERVSDGGPSTSWHYEYVVEVEVLSAGAAVGALLAEQEKPEETSRGPQPNEVKYSHLPRLGSDGWRIEPPRDGLAEQEKEQPPK